MPGTFGVEPARKQVPAAVAPPVPRPAPAPSAPEPRARRVADPWHEESRPAAPHVPAENPGVWADASATPSEPEEPGAFNTAALRSPMGQRRWLVLVIALVLGAITAAGALAVFLHDDAPSTPPPTPPPAENRSAAKTVAAAPVPAPPATFAEPQPLTALVPMNTENREPSAHASKQRRRPQNKQRPTPPTPGRLEPPAESDGVALMREAQTAFRAGNPEECISLVNRAIEHGAPAIALKLQGDCLRRAGQNAAAVRSYERFCRLMPDHPALAEVRSIVSTLGGSCP